MSAPLVSIVTTVLNGAATIERALKSVRAQSYEPIEHIVVDGGSSDGTVTILQRHGAGLAHWETAPDQGISDGFNKGLAHARGAYVGFVNADDWLEPGQIARAAAALAATGAGFVFGDLIYHAADGTALHRIQGDPAYAARIRDGMPDLNHPTVLARREVFDRIGGFDVSRRYAMDYDWLLRAHLAGFKGAYVPDLVGHMTLEGATDRRYRQAYAEVRDIAIAHGRPAWSAWSRYLFRVAKTDARRILQHLLPAGWHDALRHRVNRGFGTNAVRAGDE